MANAPETAVESTHPSTWRSTWEEAGTPPVTIFSMRFPLFLEKESQGVAAPSVVRHHINNRLTDEDPAARRGAVNSKEMGKFLVISQDKMGVTGFVIYFFFIDFFIELSVYYVCSNVLGAKR